MVVIIVVVVIDDVIKTMNCIGVKLVLEVIVML